MLDSETLRTAERLFQLEQECQREADYLAQHYRAGHVDAAAFDEISLLSSASLRAEAEAHSLIRQAPDENLLDAADVVSEEIQALVSKVKPWRKLLDGIHNVRRPPQ